MKKALFNLLLFLFGLSAGVNGQSNPQIKVNYEKLKTKEKFAFPPDSNDFQNIAGSKIPADTAVIQYKNELGLVYTLPGGNMPMLKWNEDSPAEVVITQIEKAGKMPGSAKRVLLFPEKEKINDLSQKIKNQ